MSNTISIELTNAYDKKKWGKYLPRLRHTSIAGNRPIKLRYREKPKKYTMNDSLCDDSHSYSKRSVSSNSVIVLYSEDQHTNKAPRKKTKDKQISVLLRSNQHSHMNTVCINAANVYYIKFNILNTRANKLSGNK